MAEQQRAEDFQLPMSITIPKSGVETVGLFPISHTEYRVELKDCGRFHKPKLRYSSFVWLDAELRRSVDADSMPVLPEKKKVGSMNAAFVDKRRKELEQYLQALLKLPLVMEEDAFWAFLHVGVETAAVPRFLRMVQEPDTPPDVQVKVLIKLNKMVQDEANVFRFRDEKRVLGRGVVEFLNREGKVSTVSSPKVKNDKDLRSRLVARMLMCEILSHVFAESPARQALADCGLFGALLSLLRRVTMDCQASSAVKASEAVCNAHTKALIQLIDLIQYFMDASGESVVGLFQKDDIAERLEELEATGRALHSVVAWLLLQGLQHSSLDADRTIVGYPACNLRIIDRLLTSPDLRVQVLAVMCATAVANWHKDKARRAVAERARDSQALDGLAEEEEQRRRQQEIRETRGSLDFYVDPGLSCSRVDIQPVEEEPERPEVTARRKMETVLLRLLWKVSEPTEREDMTERMTPNERRPLCLTDFTTKDPPQVDETTRKSAEFFVAKAQLLLAKLERPPMKKKADKPRDAQTEDGAVAGSEGATDADV